MNQMMINIFCFHILIRTYDKTGSEVMARPPPPPGTPLEYEGFYEESFNYVKYQHVPSMYVLIAA